jgi:CBS domain-containing protein
MNIASVLSDKGRQAITTSPAIRIDDVARKLCEYRTMNQRGFRHMPVIENRKLKGIVSSRDIIKHLLERENTDHVTMNKLNELGVY